MRGGDMFMEVGKPLRLADAAFVQHELERQGVPSRLEVSDTEGVRREAVVRISVQQQHVSAAEAIMCQMLDNEDRGEDAPRPGNYALAFGEAVSAAAIGALGMLRVGRGIPSIIGRAAVIGTVCLALFILVYRRAIRQYTMKSCRCVSEESVVGLEVQDEDKQPDA